MLNGKPWPLGLLVSVYPPRPEEVERAGALARAFGQSPLPEDRRVLRNPSNAELAQALDIEATGEQGGTRL